MNPDIDIPELEEVDVEPNGLAMWVKANANAVPPAPSDLVRHITDPASAYGHAARHVGIPEAKVGEVLQALERTVLSTLEADVLVDITAEHPAVLEFLQRSAEGELP